MKNSRKPLGPPPPGGAPVMRAPVVRLVTSVTKLGTRSRRVHGAAELPNRFGEADDHCTTDDRMPDVQFLDLGNCGHRTDVTRGESVSGVDLEAERSGVARAGHERFELCGVVEMVNVRARVELDRRGPQLARQVDRRAIRADEQARRNACFFHAFDSGANARRILRDVEAAFSGNLLASLGNEHYLMGSETFGNVEHLIGARHLEIERRRDGCGEALDIFVLNVTPVFTKMCGDAVDAGALADRGPFNRIRIEPTARLSQ